MGIFSRFRDIINANLGAMLDKAEDPEKMIRLMIGEMEDTLIEIKTTCARVLADSKRTCRLLEEAESRAAFWHDKADLAVTRGRDDLAREALLERKRFMEKGESLKREELELSGMIGTYQQEIRMLEEKLATAREKQRILVQRHVHARKKKIAQQEIRRMESAEALKKFDQFESRIERMEAEADLVNYGTTPGLEERFDKMEMDDKIEKELQALKEKNKPKE